jgi:hypothetical protein
METPRAYDFEHEITVAVLRERELNEALSCLDRAISDFASQGYNSRWQATHSRLQRPAFPTRGLGSVIRRCVVVFRTERHIRPAL